MNKETLLLVKTGTFLVIFAIAFAFLVLTFRSHSVATVVLGEAEPLSMHVPTQPRQSRQPMSAMSDEVVNTIGEENLPDFINTRGFVYDPNTRTISYNDGSSVSDVHLRCHVSHYDRHRPHLIPACPR